MANRGGGDTLLPVAEAMRIVLACAAPIGTEEVGLDRAAGRVLAERVSAPEDMPPFDRSMMDGYAIRSSDAPAGAGGSSSSGAAAIPALLDVVGSIPAGRTAAGIEVLAGQAVRIMTGAPIPAGADAVQKIEKTEDVPGAGAGGAGRVRILSGIRPGENIARKGEDLKRGGTILEEGILIRAAQAGALAAIGKTRVKVRLRPVTKLLSTGDEIVEPGASPLPHQIRNSNGPAILAALAGLGLEPVSLGIARDDPRELDAKIAEGLSGDLFILIGGVSVGDRDIVAERLLAAGVEPLFHRVAMKPGKPLLCGRRAGCIVFGLPGNPLSALTGLLVFVLPAILKMAGLPVTGLPEVRARLQGSLAQKPGRTWYRLAHATLRDGEFLAEPVRSSGSGDLASAARANAFVIVPAEVERIEDGQSVRALLWPGFELQV